ncbi:unnamed protein product, partial [Hapterophycus canaliculatus]
GVAADGTPALTEQDGGGGDGDGEIRGVCQEDGEDDVDSAAPGGEASSATEATEEGGTQQPTVPLESILDLEADEPEPGDAVDEEGDDTDGDTDGEAAGAEPEPEAAAATAAAAFEGETGMGREGSLEGSGVLLSAGGDDADAGVGVGASGGMADLAPTDSGPDAPAAADQAATTASTTSNAEAAVAAASAAREREDALTARLLVAEELLLERERQLESTNLAMAEIMQNSGGGGGGGEARAAGETTLADLRAKHQREVSRLEGLVAAEKRKGKAAADAVRSWETKAEEFQEKDKMLK